MRIWKSLSALFLILCLMPMQIADVYAASGQKPSRERRISDVLSQMSPEEKIGQLFMVAPDGDVDQLISKYKVGGIVLFSRHIQSLQQSMNLIEQVRVSSGTIPPLVAVDQEGGRVTRIKFATPVPPARVLARLDAESIRRIGLMMGEELAALGFNVNFAPVLDVNTNPANPVIGDRSFGSDPATVSQLGLAYIDGLHAAGVAACVKHFPGHGDTRMDSHHMLPVVNRNAALLDSVELLPFREAVRSGVDMIMTAHVNYPALDPAPDLPATLSQPIVTDLLRGKLGYSGIIITDAMNMKAVTNHLPAGPAALAAFQAGVDIILMPDNLEEAYSAVLNAVQNDEVTQSRLDASVRRILDLKFALAENSSADEPLGARLQKASAIVGSPQHRALMNGLLLETR